MTCDEWLALHDRLMAAADDQLAGGQTILVRSGDKTVQYAPGNAGALAARLESIRARARCLGCAWVSSYPSRRILHAMPIDDRRGGGGFRGGTL